MKRDSALNFDYIPHWTIPFRFFLTAPLFAIAAGIILTILGAQSFGGSFSSFGYSSSPLWQSRWLVEVITVLHLVTLGTITMVMVGAFFQITPVVGGCLLPGGKKVVTIVHGFLVVGALLFLVAMTTSQSWLYVVAACSLILSLGLFGVCGLIATHRTPRNSPTIMAMKLSLVSLLVMISIGVALLSMHAYPELVGFDRRWTDVHLIWALAGWVGLLIVGVSFQVIPMFHVTPSFNVHFQRWIPIVIFICVIFESIAGFYYSGELFARLSKVALLFSYGVYGVMVWRLLNKRKRKIVDITVQFWKTAVFSLLVFILLQILSESGALEQWGDIPLLFSGVLLVFGVVVSVIGGMLQKIIPFLSYLHMQRFCQGDFEAIKSLPHMRAILKVSHSKAFLRLHILSLGLLLLMIFFSEVTLFAGIAVCGEFSLLLFIIVRVIVMIRTMEKWSNAQ